MRYSYVTLTKVTKFSHLEPQITANVFVRLRQLLLLILLCFLFGRGVLGVIIAFGNGKVVLDLILSFIISGRQTGQQKV